jgi:hypothetical protein
MQRCGKAGKARADHRDVGSQLAGQPGGDVTLTEYSDANGC